jgi:ATP-dependent exoDNAse (exonuclease V) alpha subunit
VSVRAGLTRVTQTVAIDRIVTQARNAGAKVLLVGDWAQLSAIDAGGAFAMLLGRQGVDELVGIDLAPCPQPQAGREK